MSHAKIKKEEESLSLYGDIYFQNFLWLWEKWDPKMDVNRLADKTGISLPYLRQLLGRHRQIGQKTIETFIKVFGCSRLDFIQIDDINHTMQTKYYRELKKIREILESDQLQLVEMLIGNIDMIYSQLQKAKESKKKLVGE